MSLPLVTMAEAKLQLRMEIEDMSAEADIEMKILEASDIVLDWMKVDLGSPEALPWADNAIPPKVKGATLRVFTELYENRDANIDVFPDILRRLLPRVHTFA
jgi:hypothetical protein